MAEYNLKTALMHLYCCNYYSWYILSNFRQVFLNFLTNFLVKFWSNFYQIFVKLLSNVHQFLSNFLCQNCIHNNWVKNSVFLVVAQICRICLKDISKNPNDESIPSLIMLIRFEFQILFKFQKKEKNSRSIISNLQKIAPIFPPVFFLY